MASAEQVDAALEDPAVWAMSQILIWAERHCNAEVAKLQAVHGDHWQERASPTLMGLYRALEAAGE